MIRSAIVGCGAIAKVHSQALSLLPGIELVACMDTDAGLARQLAAQHACRAFESFEEMLVKSTPDVLHILTPGAVSASLAEDAAVKGIALFVESPPAVSENSWHMLSSLSGRVPIGICFQHRYDGTTKALKALLEAENLGDIRGARAIIHKARNANSYTSATWRGTWAGAGGGVLQAEGIHALDMLVHLLGSPRHCEASMSNRHLKGIIEVEDTVEAFIRFRRGISACFYATTAYAVDMPPLVEIACDRGLFRMEGDALYRIANSTGEPELLLREKRFLGGGHIDCIEDFYRCLREGKPYPLDIAAARDTMQLMLSMYAMGGMHP